MENLETYKKFCLRHPDIPFYLRYPWLEAASNGNKWGICLLEKAGEVFAFMPWFMRKKWSLTLSYQPFLIPYLGPFIIYPDAQKTSTRLSWEKEMMDQLISQLPKTGYFNQAFRPEILNWLPFYWKGFHQSTRYTYHLDLNGSRKTLWNGLKANIRRQINKANKNLIISSSNDLNLLLELKHLQAKQQGKKFHIADDYAKNLFKISKENEEASLWYAKDDQNRIHAGIWIVTDSNSAVYLMGGSHPDFKQSGAMSLLMWTAIQSAKEKKVMKFDFEGSMIKPVEHFFRSFGAEQMPYFEISKVSNPLFYLYLYFKK